MIRVGLPYHLRRLARVEGEIRLELEGVATVRTVLDALEAAHPVLRGTIRDHGTLRRRPFIRYFVCREDWSLLSEDTALPGVVTDGTEVFLVVGAMAGG